MSLKSKIPAQCDYTRPMSRSAWRLKLCSAVLIVCILAAPVRAEGLWRNIYPFNISGFSLTQGSQSAIASDMPEQAEAPLGIAQALEQVAESTRDEGQSQNPSATTADIPADIGVTPSHPLIAKSPKTDLSRQLWQARISTAGNTKPNESKNELQRIISEVSSVDFAPRQQAAKPLISFGPVQKDDPNEAATDKEIPQEDETAKIEDKLPYGRVTDETLQMLKNLTQHPEKLQNPLELGEILFRSHCLKEAAKCYREAISRMTDGEAGQARDTAWLLFQTGNCLRRDDPAAAIQMYEKLIADYPDSPWATLAKAKSELVGWYVKDAPDKLIDEYK